MLLARLISIFSSVVVWIGDLNMRVDRVSRVDGIAHVNAQNYAKLLETDQVSPCGLPCSSLISNAFTR